MQDISDCLSPQAQHVAEARLAAKRAARAEAREIRMKELERQQKEVEERSDKDFGEKDSLAEVEEKYKRSMVTNAQLDNEKTSLQYQVDTLREVLLELEEELFESRRQYDDKHKECERQRHDQNVLRFQLAEMKEALEQRESLLAKHGIALDSVGTPNGDASLEPHVNADGRPDPPIRATSMGPSEKAMEKKETMSVVGEISPSKPEQDNQESLLAVASETQHNAELGDTAKEQNIQEITSSSNDDIDGHTIASSSNDDVHAGGCQNLEHQGEGLPSDLESASNKNEKAVDECAPPNVNIEVLKLNVSEVSRETTLDPSVSSPGESEVFQDALDNIVLSPCATSPPSNKLEDCGSNIGNEDHDISKQDFSREEEQYEVQSTSVESKSDPNSGALEVSKCRENTAMTTDDTGDLHTDTTDGQQLSSNDSLHFKSEERAANEMTTTPVEHESVCEEVVKPEEQTVTVEFGLQSRKDDSEIRDSNANYTFSEKELVSTETALHTKVHDEVEEKNTVIAPEQSSQEVQDTQLLDSENNNFSEVPEPCIARSTQSTVEIEPTRDSDIFEDSISHLDQHEDNADAESLKADLKSLENEKNNIVFQNAQETLDIGEQDTFSDMSEKVSEKPKSSNAPDEGKPDRISENPQCIKSENIEKINPALLDASNEENLEKTSEPPNQKLSTNDNVTNVPETAKETLSSETISEGMSTPEGEESDDNNDNEDDVAIRSEKYSGESLPLGSSVDQTSADDDIRMEDSADKAARRGKGKNKEDCVVS